MREIVLHPETRKVFEKLHDNLPQSLLLSGDRGVGLLTLATSIAGPHLAGIVKPQDAKEHIDNENGVISVEMIRRLYEQTRAKHTQRQVIIIDDADRMSLGAQSAFLKLLEEPNGQIHFIMTSHRTNILLPTIRSRVQSFMIRPITSEQTVHFIDSLSVSDVKRRAQLIYIADGLPAELVRLTVDEAYFKTQAEIISDARDFLQADPYKKLLVAHKYRSNRDLAQQLINNAIQILQRTLTSNPQPIHIKQLEQLLSAKEHIASNYSIPLQLAQLVL